MLRPTPRYGRARYSTRAAFTRRALLGAAALVTGAGLADLMHRPRRGPVSDANASAFTGSTPPAETKAARSSHLTPHPTQREPGVTSSATPTGSAASLPGSSVGGHAGSAQHPSRPAQQPHGHGDAPGPRHDPTKSRRAQAERVKLPPPKVQVQSRPIYEVKTLIHHPPPHAIALTVDDGPDPDWTPKVLRLLDKYRMQASFCVVGVNAEAYPRLVRDVAKAGHVIVNHSYTHVQPFNHQTEKRIVAEITKTQRAIERVAKVEPQLFRAPGGAWSPFIFRALAAYGLFPLDWDVDPDDWARPGTRKIERAMLRGRPGDIVLCHDGGGNRSETVRALRKVLPAWKHRNYTTIPLVVPSHYRRLPDPTTSSPAASSTAADPSETNSP